MKIKVLGQAKRVQVTTACGARATAWDCRPFGLGRIIAPKIPIKIELEPGMDLELATGELSVSEVPKSLAS
ncbi:MAG: hypothetical protein AB7V27_13585 [Candidatus Binatia bacterium]